jgi:hypothetical protein
MRRRHGVAVEVVPDDVTNSASADRPLRRVYVGNGPQDACELIVGAQNLEEAVFVATHP